MMRIVNWNILDGGVGRADPLAEVILAQRADVVALSEADDAEVVRRIAHRAGTDFIHARGGRRAAALLSHWAIRHTIDHAAIRSSAGFHTLLEALVVSPCGREWPVGVVHMDARVARISEVLDLFAEHRRLGQEHLLVADFGGYATPEPIERILDAGYVDTLQCHEQVRRAAASLTAAQPQRLIGRVLAFGVPRACMRSAWIEQDRLARYASDHLPVGAEIG